VQKDSPRTEAGRSSSTKPRQRNWSWKSRRTARKPGNGCAAIQDPTFFFRDATSGKESYPLGRYVDLKRLENGRYILDFNLAYNPACAFSDFYNCPIPPKANTLKAAIRDGEMDSRYH
jgi:uncharacterized protein (DUF1684 family)